jgi:hypothetical protein
MIGYDDLDDARSEVMRLSRRRYPNVRALDTDAPRVQAGLEVVEFDAAEAVVFARGITSANLHRISIARKQYAIDLFTACYASGMTTGAMAQRRRSSN